MSYYVHNPFQRGMVVLSHNYGGRVSPVGVVINETIGSLEVGDSGQLTATVSYNDSSQVNSADTPSVVNWSSSDESKLTIDSDGNFSCLSDGWVDITVSSSEDETITDSISVLVGYELAYSIVVGEISSSLAHGYRKVTTGDDIGSVDNSDWPDENGNVIAELAGFQYLRSTTSDHSGFLNAYPRAKFRNYDAINIKIVNKTTGSEFDDSLVWPFISDSNQYERPNEDTGDFVSIMGVDEEIEVWIKEASLTRDFAR